MYGNYGKINAGATTWPSTRAVALRQIVKSKTTGIFGDPQALAQSLTEEKLSDTAQKQVELALTAEPLRKFLLLEKKEPTAVDINNLLCSVADCGLSDQDAREVLEDLLYSVDITYVLNNRASVKQAYEHGDKAKYIPPFVYRAELEQITKVVALGKSDDLTAEMLETLKMYADCGIGEANCLLGVVYRRGFGVPEDQALSRQYLLKAEAAGYPPAYAWLGDEKFDSNDYDAAYAYYSKPGAIALGKTRIQKMNTLFKAKRFAKKVCAMLMGIYALILAVMLLVCNNLPLIGGHPVIVGIFVFLETALMGFVFLVHHKMPFKDVRGYGLGFAIIFALYLVLVLI